MGQFLPVEDLFFDINAKMEEQKKTGDDVTLGFNLIISTKPNVVKYLISGSAILSGKAADVKKKLEVNPKTKIPQILFTVYQHAFNSIYMLSSVLNTPYPPPDLLHPMGEKIQIVPAAPEKAQTENQPEMQVAPPETVQTTPTAPAEKTQTENQQAQTETQTENQAEKTQTENQPEMQVAPPETVTIPQATTSTAAQQPTT